MNLLPLYLMSLAYIFTGITHFVKPRIYLRIMPRVLPASWHAPVVSITGIWELAAGVLLLPSLTRPWAAWSIIVLLIVVFPANVQMMLNFKRKHHPLFWATVLRLPIQLLLIWWAWIYT